MRLPDPLAGLSVRGKLLAGYLGILLVALAIGAIVYIGLERRIEADAQVRIEETEIGTANLLIKQLVDMETGARGFVITGRDEFLEPYLKARASFEVTLASILRSVDEDPSAQALLRDIAAQARAWYGGTLEHEIAVRRDSPTAAADLVAGGRGKAQLDAIRALVDEYTSHLMGLRTARAANLDEADRLVQRLLLIGGVVGAVGLLLGLLVTTSISRKVRRLQESAEVIAAGQLSQPMPTPAGGDEIDALARAFAKMRDNVRGLIEAQGALAAAETAARQEAEQATRAKTEFLASMSHELRTPLNAILGFSDLLREQLAQTITDRQRRYLANVHDAGQHLLALINDILDLSKVEAGRIELRPELVTLDELAAPVVSSTRVLAEARSISITTDTGGSEVVFLDVARVRQLLYNLTSNALKFTPAGGGVELRQWVEGRDLRIEVSDTGIGIPADRQDRVFGQFERVNEDRSDSTGTGLGLALTKRLVELQGGTIDFVSAEGKGTTFRVRLPDVSAALTKGGRVLVVEDERRDAELIVALASEHGFRSEVVPSANAALAAIARESPLAVVLDLRLPDARGETVIDALQERGEQRVPIAVVTVEDDDGMSVRLGADMHLTKPLDRARLAAWFARLPAVSGAAANGR